MKWFWGALIFLVGVYFLGANLGLWSHTALIEIWRLWPILLIILGIAVLVRRWQYGWMIILASFVAGAGFVIYAYNNPDVIHLKKTTVTQDEKSYDISEVIPEGVQSAFITVDTGAVDFNVKSESSKLVEGKLTSTYTSPDVTVTTVNDQAIVNIKTNSNNTIPSSLNFKNKLELNLTNKIPVILAINSGASSIDLDLSGAKLAGLTLSAGASSMKVRLGEDIQDNPTLAIKAGASSIEVQAPSKVGLMVTTKAGLTGTSIEGMDKIGSGVYRTKDYNRTFKKAALTIDAGASSIKVSTY